MYLTKNIGQYPIAEKISTPENDVCRATLEWFENLMYFLTHLEWPKMGIPYGEAAQLGPKVLSGPLYGLYPNEWYLSYLKNPKVIKSTHP